LADHSGTFLTHQQHVDRILNDAAAVSALSVADGCRARHVVDALQDRQENRRAVAATHVAVGGGRTFPPDIITSESESPRLGYRL